VEKSETQRLRILLLIPHLGGGGAERVMALLASNLPNSKYELHLGLITPSNPGLETLPPWVTVHELGASRVRTSAVALLKLVWRLRPDVILSGMAHLNFLVLMLRSLLPRKTLVLVRQNATISASLASDRPSAITRLLYRIWYPLADRIICQSTAMADDLIDQLGIPQDRVSVLPNPVDVTSLRAAQADSPGQWSGPGPHLLAVGRLSREKGFDLLLKALSVVRLRFPQTDLVIVGSGVEEGALKLDRDELGLTTAVRLPGYVDRPQKFFPGASAFVLSSRHEGMPNALLEAAAAGLPIVAVPCSRGVTELLQGQSGTWLASHIAADALAASLMAALEVVCSSPRFHHSFVDQFAIEQAIPVYESLIDAVYRERAM
jgi:glycosyltransferase involved in cell wall biosynthesis